MVDVTQFDPLFVERAKSESGIYHARATQREAAPENVRLPYIREASESVRGKTRFQVKLEMNSFFFFLRWKSKYAAKPADGTGSRRRQEREHKGGQRFKAGCRCANTNDHVQRPRRSSRPELRGALHGSGHRERSAREAGKPHRSIAGGTAAAVGAAPMRAR